MGTQNSDVDSFTLARWAENKKLKRNKFQLTTRISQLRTKAAVE
jgi:hypothetical protein